MFESIKTYAADIAIKSDVMLTDGPYKLTGGRMTPIYLLTERVRRNAADSDSIASIMRTMTMDLEDRFDLNAAGETRGITFASNLATKNGKPVVTIRKEAKEYGIGTKNPGYRVADMLPDEFEGKSCILVDDIIMYGGSCASFIDGIRDSGADVEYCIAVIDRQQGGVERINDKGVEVFTLTDIDTILKRSVEFGRITRAKEEEIRLYLEDDKAWHAKNGFPYPDI